MSSPSRLPRLVAYALAVLCGVISLGCSVALPFAPVITQQTEVQWPATGEPARSTTALFAPYRPAEFRLEVPCSTIQNTGAEPVTLLSTVPAHSPREGLTLTAHSGRPSLRMGEGVIPLPNLPEVPANAARAACLLVISSTSQAPGHTRIDVGGTGVTPLRSMELPGLPAPEIFQFQTSLGTAEAAGLKVTARTFSWFDTSPTALKAELISAAVGFAVIALLLLMQHRPPRVRLARVREALNRQRFRRVPVHLALGLLDLAVLVIFAGWAIIGPLTDDDGFAMLTIRNFQDAGDIGNFYRWFNASETPFTLVQHLMYGLIDNGYVSLAPLALRTPSVVAGVLTWLVLSRGIVQPLCRLQGWRRIPLHLVTGVFFLATWLPFNLGIRPEAFVTLGMCLVFALLLRATGDPDQPRARFAWLGLAAGATGLTLAVTPTAVAALFVVALFAPRIARLLWTVPEGSAAPRWLVVPTRALLVASVGGLGLVAMFADSTWNGVKQATHIHNEFGPSMGWYQEINRYSSLLGTESWGAAGKRMAVLLVLAALLISAVGVLRSLHQRAQLGSLPLLWGSVAGIFLALWLTPSKWSHHFGSLAGLGAALLAVTLVLLVRAGRADSAASSRTPALLGIVGTIAGSLAAALAFMGPNEWWRYSDMAMAWSDTPVALPQLPLNDPLLWALVAACVGLLTLGIVAAGNVLRVRRAQHQPAAEQAPQDPSTDPIPVLTADSVAVSDAGQDAQRRSAPGWSALPWTGMPASVLSLAALSSVAVLLGTFAAAPASLPHSYSIARANWDSLVDRSCGIEPEVETLPLAEQQPLAEGSDQLAGFSPGGPGSTGPPKEPRVSAQGELLGKEPVAGSEIAWNSQSGNSGGATGPQNTGRMTSRWFALPRMEPGNVVSFWVAGRPEQGNELAVEFGEATPTGGGDENDGEETNPEAGARVFRKEILRDPPATDPPFDDPRHGRPVDWRDFTQWRLLHLDFRDVPRAATHLRVTAVDTSTDPQGWLAVSAPMVRRVVPLPAVLERQSPMLIDWPISFVFGCRVNYPRVGNGTADSPQVMISPREGPYSMAFDTEVGGVFAGVATVSRYSELPTRLRNAPGITWGHVYLLGYEMDRDGYDQRHWPVVTPGAGGDGEYPFEPH